MTSQVRPKLLLVAMLLATVVLAACGGDESEQPPETPTLANEPPATAGLPAPTPTVQPALATPTVQPGSAAPPAIDTADWLTHTSPLGFSIKYPPGWLLEMVNENHTRIRNPVLLQLVEDLRARGHEGGFSSVAGMAEFSVHFNAFPGFDMAYLKETCENARGFGSAQRQGQAQVTPFAGRNSISCVATIIYGNNLKARELDFRVEFRPGETLLIGGYVIAPADLDTVEAILNSFKLLAGIQLSPPASPR